MSDKNTRRTPRPGIICLEGNGARPSHRGVGFPDGGVMYTLNIVEVHAVCYDEDEIFGNRISPDG